MNGRYMGRGRGGFTLIEVLTSVAVLGMLMLMLTQMLGLVTDSWRVARQNVDNYSRGRAVLERFASDIQAGIFSYNLPDPFEMGSYTFYTKVPGASSANDDDNARFVSAVRYLLDKEGKLFRISEGDEWSKRGANSVLAFGATRGGANVSLGPEPRFEMTSGVAGFQVAFLQETGELSQTIDRSTRSVVIAMAVVDRSAEVALGDRFKEFQDDLGTLSVGSGRGSRFSGVWEERVSSKEFIDRWPKQVRTGVKVLERTVPLPTLPHMN